MLLSAVLRETNTAVSCVRLRRETIFAGRGEEETGQVISQVKPSSLECHSRGDNTLSCLAHKVSGRLLKSSRINNKNLVVPLDVCSGASITASSEAARQNSRITSEVLGQTWARFGRILATIFLDFSTPSFVLKSAQKIFQDEMGF